MKICCHESYLKSKLKVQTSISEWRWYPSFLYNNNSNRKSFKVTFTRTPSWPQNSLLSLPLKFTKYFKVKLEAFEIEKGERRSSRRTNKRRTCGKAILSLKEMIYFSNMTLIGLLAASVPRCALWATQGHTSLCMVVTPRYYHTLSPSGGNTHHWQSQQ